MENENVSLWNKKAEELTVGDSLKVGAATLGICIVVPLTGLMIVGGVAHLVEKFKSRNAAKLELVKTEE